MFSLIKYKNECILVHCLKVEAWLISQPLYIYDLSVIHLSLTTEKKMFYGIKEI